MTETNAQHRHDFRFYGWRDRNGFVSFIVVPAHGVRLERCACGEVREIKYR